MATDERARPEDLLVHTPSSFVLDGETFDVSELLPLIPKYYGVSYSTSWRDTSKLRRGDHPLIGKWWAFVWETACAEVSQRFGPEHRIFRQDDLESGLNTEGLYRLWFVPESERDQIQEKRLLSLWWDLASFERRQGRRILNEELGRFRDQQRSQRL